MSGMYWNNQEVIAAFYGHNGMLPPSFRTELKPAPDNQLLYSLNSIDNKNTSNNGTHSNPPDYSHDGPTADALKARQTASTLAYTIDGHYGPRLKNMLNLLHASLQKQQNELPDDGNSNFSLNSSSSSLCTPAEWESHPATLAVHATRIMAHLLCALQVTCLDTDDYSKLFKGHVLPYLDYFSESVFFLNSNVDAFCGLDWYKVVQVIDVALPRAYLMIEAAFYSSDTTNRSVSAGLMEDLVCSLRACQHPLKALFLRHHFLRRLHSLTSSRKHSLQPFVHALCDNWGEMHKAWLRYAFLGSLDKTDKQATDDKFKQVPNDKLLKEGMFEEGGVLEAIVSHAFKQLLIDAESFKSCVLPCLLAHAVACKNQRSQRWLLDKLKSDVEPEWHYMTIDILIESLGSFTFPGGNEKGGLKEVVLEWMQYLSDHASDAQTKKYESEEKGASAMGMLSKLWCSINSLRDLSRKDALILAQAMLILTMQAFQLSDQLGWLIQEIAQFLTTQHPVTDETPLADDEIEEMEALLDTFSDPIEAVPLLKWIHPVSLRYRICQTCFLSKIQNKEEANHGPYVSLVQVCLVDVDEALIEQIVADIKPINMSLWTEFVKKADLSVPGYFYARLAPQVILDQEETGKANEEAGKTDAVLVLVKDLLHINHQNSTNSTTKYGPPEGAAKMAFELLIQRAIYLNRECTLKYSLLVEVIITCRNFFCQFCFLGFGCLREARIFDRSPTKLLAVSFVRSTCHLQP